MSDAREAVLELIRERLRGVQGPPLPAVIHAQKDIYGGPGGRADRFCSLLESGGTRVHRVPDVEAAGVALARIAGAMGAQEIALSDSPVVQRASAALEGEVFAGWSDRERLLSCDLGVSAAQAGIAETGTLVLFNESERHRLVSLVPPAHVALIEASDIVGTLGDALGAAQDLDGGPPPLVTFITGPSRTADIELTLVVGVHGPKTLDVILIESP